MEKTSGKYTEKNKIGIFDSGLGGLSVWSEVVRLMPNQATVYYADSAHCPYGGKSAEEIFSLTEKGVKWLMGKGASIVILACNTATGAAIGKLREKYPHIPFIGIEPAIKKAAENTKSGVIGIMATRFTLQSDKYRRTKKACTGQCRVLEQAGEGLVELVEAGQHTSPEAERLLTEYISPMIAEGADELVLGCTHYPFLMPAIRKIADGRMEIIDPAPFVAKHAHDVMAERGIDCSGDSYEFHSTVSGAHSRQIRQRALKLLL